MICPACKTDVPEGTALCPKCQPASPAPKKRRRRRDAEENLDPEQVAWYDRQVEWLLYLVAASAVPFVGLVLGPVSAGLAGWLLIKGRRDPAFTARKGARKELLFAVFCTVVQWAGLGLMIAGRGSA